MATWSDLKNYVRSNYQIDEETDGMMRLTFNTSGGRSQIVFLFLASPGTSGIEWVQVESPIGPFAEVPYIPMLREVSKKVCGGVAAIDDFVTYRHSVPLANLDIDEFEQPLLMVTSTADELEQLLLGRDVV